MNAAEARALFFQRKLRIENLETSLPDLEELDGHLAIMELPASATTHADKLSKGQDGETESDLLLGAMVAKSLVLRESKERIFSDTDIQTVADFGLSVLTPLSQMIAEVSGLNPDAFTNAKKN